MSILNEKYKDLWKEWSVDQVCRDLCGTMVVGPGPQENSRFDADYNHYYVFWSQDYRRRIMVYPQSDHRAIARWFVKCNDLYEEVGIPRETDSWVQLRYWVQKWSGK